MEKKHIYMIAEDCYVSAINDEYQETDTETVVWYKVGAFPTVEAAQAKADEFNKMRDENNAVYVVAVPLR